MPSMPYERASPATANTRLPQMPTVARAINKPPLTPKVAARASTPQLQQNSTPTLVTPLPRRGTRPNSVVLTTHNSNDSNPSREREDLASPVSAFLSTNNITPRSGPRQGRVNSANSTPNGTPSQERHDTWETRSGLGISAPGADDGHLVRPAVTFSPPSEVGGGTRQDPDSKFFYASGVQIQKQQTPQQPPLKPLMAPQQQKQTTFFYANGETVAPRDRAASPVPLGPVLSAPAPQDTLMSKFVYANGIPDLQPVARPSLPPSAGSGSAVSTSSRIPTSRPGNAAGNPNPPSVRSPASTPAISVIGQSSQWKPATETPTRPPLVSSHTRNGSLTIAEPPAVARIMSAHGSLPSSESCPLSMIPNAHSLPSNPATSGFATLLQAAEEFAEPEDMNSESLNSPTKSSSQDNQLTDLVASARRERKVQDLQITNASLEAINRTLERQLRKQTAEIRRYRRLSRSGRLSLNSTGRRIASDSTVDGGALARAGMDLDDLSEEESELDAEEEEQDEEDFSDSDESGELSPNTIAFRDARHRQKDEQRLQLDLSKHQQLLVDSQKINQSLKRCLGWTEELIKEGKRALEYKVRVSEVEIGGRVLAPEDIERRNADLDVSDDEDDDEDDTLHVPKSTFQRKTDDTEVFPWSKDPQDRDSGIELPAEGG
ncbi:hypothetical protein B0H63DRAFT_504459 [Podospora didyma]|uniref:Uncharacterized protein n=1 Tax=Podospora didyma TaxID=330526 RepID=A0AAE0N1K3_9PEZI|nr:hypothetical protein B0H63DRAFT_504459 [Podospora didyma]